MCVSLVGINRNRTRRDGMRVGSARHPAHSVPVTQVHACKGGLLAEKGVQTMRGAVRPEGSPNLIRCQQLPQVGIGQGGRVRHQGSTLMRSYLQACVGGALRWFVMCTPTKIGFSFEMLKRMSLGLASIHVAELVLHWSAQGLQ